MKQQTLRAQHTKLDTTTLIADLPRWLIDHADGAIYLLAHAEDGVIWGRLEGSSLSTSHDAFAAECQTDLRIETLWQCRLFGPASETLVWRDDDGWHACRTTDVQDANALALDEDQMLWGTGGVASADGRFTLLHDGSEGLRHPVPIHVPATAFEQDERPLRLRVRHYTAADASGVARIVASRLVTLQAPGAN